MFDHAAICNRYDAVQVSANWDKRLGLGADNFNFAIDLDAAGQQHGVAVRTTLAAGGRCPGG